MPNRESVALSPGRNPAPHCAHSKQHARQWLPGYLQPDVWTQSPSLPYASNGKVDRQALLGLPVQATSIGSDQPAQTPLQTQLADLWSELLQVPVAQLSIDDSFFNLGGHSILLSTLLLRIRERFGRSLGIEPFLRSADDSHARVADGR